MATDAHRLRPVPPPDPAEHEQLAAAVVATAGAAFLLWGDAVNTAARMQATGIPGRIQVSAGTAERASSSFRFEPRAVEVKGLGSLTTYLLVR